MKDFSQLKKNLKNDFGSLKNIKVAVLGDTATQFLIQALRGTGYDHGFNLQIWEADFNQIERQVFDTGSDLYEFNPEVVVIFQSSHKLLAKYNKLKPEQYSSLAAAQLELIEHICSILDNNLSAKIIYYNYTEINDAVFGNYANKIESSFLFQLRKLNYGLMEFATRQSNFYPCDISSIQNQVGKTAFFQTSIYINTEMVLSLDVLPDIAAKTLDLIAALYGKFKKCLILDLEDRKSVV